MSWGPTGAVRKRIADCWPDSLPDVALWSSLALLLSISVWADRAGAQSAEPFSQSIIGVGYASDLHSTLLNDYWREPGGAAIHWQLPFYLGNLEFRAAWLPLRSRRESVPDVNNVLTTMAWGLPLTLTDRLTLSGSVHIGNNFMYRRDYGPLDGPESEFSAGIAAALQYRLTSSLGLRADLHHTRVYTYHRMDLRYAAASLEWTIRTPDRLVRFLQ